MIRLTVLYKLTENIDLEEFLEWRLNEHQQNNADVPGVIRTDFSQVRDTWPPGAERHYDFTTTLDWPDRATFEAGFYSDTVQNDLQKNLRFMRDPVFLISEILSSDSNESEV